MKGRMFSFMNTSGSDKEVTLSKCKHCGAFFLDHANSGSCCEEKKEQPFKIMQNNLMQFLMDRRR